jgi:dTDP-4-amino-4,6-dideoxygalactose transaminase
VFVPVEHGLDPRWMLPAHRAPNAVFPMSASAHMYFHRARNAIYHLFRSLGLGPGETVLVPDYHNGNEVQAIRAAGATVRFYRIGRNLEVDLEHLTRLARTTRARVLFVIHYFGWPQPVKELTALSEAQDLLLVEDCALSLLSSTLGRPIGSFGRYATFCLYKTLPVPNGGVLVANDGGLDGLGHLVLDPCRLATRAGRTIELMLEWLRGRAYAPGAIAFAVKRAAGRTMTALEVPRVPFGDIGFDLDSVNVAVAPLSRTLLDRFDYEDIKRRRRRNYQLLRDLLEPHVAVLPRELEDGTCPLIFPLLVPDKPRAAALLQAEGISAMEFWNGGDPETRRPEHADAWYLREHLVELPIHQDITPEQIAFMARGVLSLGLHF